MVDKCCDSGHKRKHNSSDLSKIIRLYGTHTSHMLNIFYFYRKKDSFRKPTEFCDKTMSSFYNFHAIKMTSK